MNIIPEHLRDEFTQVANRLIEQTTAAPKRDKKKLEKWVYDHIKKEDKKLFQEVSIGEAIVKHWADVGHFSIDNNNIHWKDLDASESKNSTSLPPPPKLPKQESQEQKKGTSKDTNDLPTESPKPKRNRSLSLPMKPLEITAEIIAAVNRNLEPEPEKEDQEQQVIEPKRQTRRSKKHKPVPDDELSQLRHREEKLTKETNEIRSNLSLAYNRIIELEKENNEFRAQHNLPPLEPFIKTKKSKRLERKMAKMRQNQDNSDSSVPNTPTNDEMQIEDTPEQPTSTDKKKKKRKSESDVTNETPSTETSPVSSPSPTSTYQDGRPKEPPPSFVADVSFAGAREFRHVWTQWERERGHLYAPNKKHKDNNNSSFKNNINNNNNNVTTPNKPPSKPTTPVATPPPPASLLPEAYDEGTWPFSIQPKDVVQKLHSNAKVNFKISKKGKEIVIGTKTSMGDSIQSAAFQWLKEHAKESDYKSLLVSKDE